MRTGLILAGGESNRFGRPKPFVPLRGRPVLAWVADALAPLTDELVVSVATENQEHQAAAILPFASFVRDRGPRRGPIEGLVRGIGGARGDPVLVAPCDAPLLRPELYELLLKRLGAHDASVPRLGVFDPVRAVYRREPVLRIRKAGLDAIPSPSALVDRLDAAFVDLDAVRAVDPGLLSFLDLNRPEDLVRAEEELRRPGPPASA